MFLKTHPHESQGVSLFRSEGRSLSLPDDGIVQGLVEGWRVWRLNKEGEITALTNRQLWPVNAPLRAEAKGHSFELILLMALLLPYVTIMVGALVYPPDGVSPWKILAMELSLGIVILHHGFMLSPCHWTGDAPCDGLGFLRQLIWIKHTRCGIHAYKSEADAYSQINVLLNSPIPGIRQMNRMHTYVIGRVALWGKVVEHESGYRGELAYPLEFTDIKTATPCDDWARTLLNGLNHTYNTEAAKRC